MIGDTTGDFHGSCRIPVARNGSRNVLGVLFVDCGRDDRTMYADFLRECQFHVVEIDSAADALALAHTVDAVVTGVRVPGRFDGVELVRRIRSDERTANAGILQMPVVLAVKNHSRAGFHESLRNRVPHSARRTCHEGSTPGHHDVHIAPTSHWVHDASGPTHTDHQFALTRD